MTVLYVLAAVVGYFVVALPLACLVGRMLRNPEDGLR